MAANRTFINVKDNNIGVDFIDIYKIDAIHIDKDNRKMLVLCSGAPIEITSKTYQRVICEMYLNNYDCTRANRILNFVDCLN